MEKIKKLGFFISSEAFGGLEMNFLNLAEWLSESGLEVLLIADHKAKSISKQGIKRGLRVKVMKTGRKYFSLGFGMKLSKILSKEEISVLVFSHGPDIDSLAWAKFFSPRLRIIYMQQMQLGLKKKNPYQSWRYSKIDKWVAPLSWLMKEATDLTNIDPDKIVEIPLGQDFKNLVNGKGDPMENRGSLGLPKDKILIGSLGRLDPAKGIETIIKALREIRSTRDDVELVIMGENTRNMPGDHKKELETLADSLQLGEVVHFLPFSEQVQTFYGAIDIFVMASKKETFGMVTIEAMANEVEVFGTDAGGTSEILDSGKTGTLFSPGNSSDLANKILSYLNQGEMKDGKKSLARVRAVSNYSREVVVEKYLGLLESL